MKQFISLLKAQFISALSTVARKKSFRVPAIAGIVLGASVVFYFLVRLARFLFLFRLPGQFASIDIAPFILNSVVLAMLIFLFLASFSVVLGSLYLSSDTKLLLSMPIPESAIFASKFVFANLEECIYPLVLVYPFFVGFGVAHRLGLLFFVGSFLFTVSLSLIPFSLAALIIIPLANKVSIKKLQTIALVLNVIFGILIYAISQIPNPAFHIMDAKKLPDFALKTRGILHFLPTNIAVSFSYAFKNSHPVLGIIEVILFVAVGAALFYIALLFAKKNYREGLFKAERIESVKVSRSIAEKEIINTRVLSKHVNALLSKDIKILTRDPSIKTTALTFAAYIIFFLFMFIVMPMKGHGKPTSDATFMSILYFVIADFILCGQSTLILLFADRESIWVPLLSKVKSSEFIWSKFIIPFVSGEVVNILLFLMSFALVKGSNARLLFITLPFAIFLPFLFTSSAIFSGMLFPSFKTPKNPRKLVSGKAVLVNGVIYLVFITITLIPGFVLPHLIKLKGLAFTVGITFLIMGVITIAVSFPLIAFAINRYKNLEIQN